MAGIRGLRQLYSKADAVANVLRCSKLLFLRGKFFGRQFLTGAGASLIFRPTCAAGPFPMSCGEPAGISRRFARARTDLVRSRPENPQAIRWHPRKSAAAGL